MRKNSLKLGATFVALMLTLTGCGNQIPDLTDEEMQMVGEYAAITLLKYDANHRSRLVDTALLETEEQESEEQVEEPVKEETEQQPEFQPEEVPVIVPEKVPAEGALTPVIPVAEAEIETFYELPQDVKIEYKGYEIYDSYPDDTTNDYLTVEAAEGKKLLVLQFEVNNGTGAEQAVDLFSSTTVYDVTVNGSHEQKALTTMLVNDMSTFMSSVQPESNQEMVLMVEIEETISDSISSITLKMKNEPKIYIIQLL